MATKETAIRLSPPRTLPSRNLIAGVITAVVLALSATAVVVATDRVDEPNPVVEPGTRSRDQMMQDWVNRGLIPARSLEPAAPTRDELMQVWVNRGLIPPQSLDTPIPTRDELLRDWVNRGLIPALAMDG